MVDKKTLAFAIMISWILTLVTILFLSNFVPNLTQGFSQQFTESNNVKTISFSKQEIQNVSETNKKALYFNFTWTPSNPHKNSILAILFSFEYKCNELTSNFWENKTAVNWLFGQAIAINEYRFNPEYLQKSAQNLSEWNQQWSSEWEKATYQTTLSYTRPNESIKPLKPNQNQYPIQLFFVHDEVSTYIRNVNLTLLVIDG